ncbi:hypothetical protein DYU11_20230 [Fibrisoma montanum]|uniref:Uncharacterized protein n=1 Tax=Fibrisoma montanum TaxID=2305895 RepID=A0A418M3R3_9BACT|nr:hypothetical protein [Fibrisoma montanum]RIV20381.1 hypothetical protein DYU11_20230 [Fibrisoma montanum]
MNLTNLDVVNRYTEIINANNAHLHMSEPQRKEFDRHRLSQPVNNHVQHLCALRCDQAAAKKQEKQTVLDEVREKYLYATQLDPTALVELSYNWEQGYYVARIAPAGIVSFVAVGNRPFEVSAGLVCDKFTRSELDLLIEWDA